ATQKIPGGDLERPPQANDPATPESAPPVAVPADQDEKSEAEPEPAQPGGMGSTSFTPLPALLPAAGDGHEATLSDRERGDLDIKHEPEVISELTLLAEEINASFHEVIGSCRTTVMHAFRVGQLLLQAKKLIKHGDFTAWLRENCRGISVSTAREYMR